MTGPHPTGLTAREMIDAIAQSPISDDVLLPADYHFLEDVAEVLTRGGCPSIVDVDRLRKLYDRVRNEAAGLNRGGDTDPPATDPHLL